jgi:hypothetical protein
MKLRIIITLILIMPKLLLKQLAVQRHFYKILTFHSGITMMCFINHLRHKKSSV